MRVKDEAAEIGHRDTLRVFGRALRYALPFRQRFGVKVGLTILSLLPALALPWPVKIVVDHVILGVPIDQPTTPFPGFIEPLVAPLVGAGPIEILLWLALVQGVLIIAIGAFGTTGSQRDITSGSLAAGRDTATRTENEANWGFSFAGGLFGLVDYRFAMRLTQDLNHYYRSALFERIQRLPMTSFDDERIGDAVYRVMYDTPAITRLCFEVILTTLVAPVQLLLTLLVLHATFGEHPGIAWAAFMLLPLSLLTTFPFARTVRRRGQQSRSAGAATTATVEEGMTNILAVQSLGGEAREQTRFDSDSWKSFNLYRSYIAINVVLFLVRVVVMSFVVGWVLIYVTDLVIAGGLSAGDFTLLFSYFFQVSGYATRFGEVWIRLQGEAPGLNRVFFMMDLPSEEDPPSAEPLPRLTDKIQLEHVDYVYPDGTQALHDVSLEIPLGKVTALVGTAGAGKTTVAYMVPRFLSPTRGRITFDGIDLERATHDSLRSQLSFVFQETALFDDTVEENIRMANPEASEADIRRAAQLADADEFIQKLPQGYKTRLGRGGGKLSVGQKQRLTIARALVRDASILVFDEPTSALDPETEQRLVATLREASRERAVIIIAHRLSTIRSADHIAVLDEGRILESGSHDELMSRPDGAYRRMVELQSRSAA